MEIKYQIELLSCWHCGSGLDSGLTADLLVIKDENDLPYIPGKTIKGLLKDALREMMAFDKPLQDVINEVFGHEEKEGDKVVRTYAGMASFSNATLPEEERKEITSNNLQRYLYRNIASTAINEQGVAKAKSLRTMEVCIPVTLTGEIHFDKISDDIQRELSNAMKWTRYLGSGRNRGLGRCKWSIVN